VNDEPGVALTPDGSPRSVTLTEPLKPFFGVTETVTFQVTFPMTAEAETGETDKLKSCTGGGGDLLPPPQAASDNARAYPTSDSRIALEVNRVFIRLAGKRNIYIPEVLFLSTGLLTKPDRYAH
jgi:hypothetical protein